MYGINNFYTFLIVLLSLFQLFFEIIFKNNTSKKKILFNISCFILLIVASLRGTNVGGDLENYLPHFHELCSTPWSSIFDLKTSNFEPLYTIFVKLISCFSEKEFFFIFFTSLLSLFGQFRFVSKYSPFPCISLLLFFLLGFYTNTYNNIRQSIAISIVFFSITPLLRRNLIKFVIIVIIASLFHYSAIFFLVSYPLLRINLTKKNFVLLIIGGVVFFGIIGNYLLNFFISNIFLKYESASADGSGKSLLILYYGLSFISYTLYRYVRDVMTAKERIFAELLIKFLIITTYVQMFTSLYTGISRLAYYFYIPIVILIPFLINKIRKPSLKVMLYTSTICILFYYMCAFIYAYNSDTNSNSQGVVPYTTIFNDANF